MRGAGTGSGRRGSGGARLRSRREPGVRGGKGRAERAARRAGHSPGVPRSRRQGRSCGPSHPLPGVGKDGAWNVRNEGWYEMRAAEEGAGGRGSPGPSGWSLGRGPAGAGAGRRVRSWRPWTPTPNFDLSFWIRPRCSPPTSVPFDPSAGLPPSPSPGSCPSGRGGRLSVTGPENLPLGRSGHVYATSRGLRSRPPSTSTDDIPPHKSRKGRGRGGLRARRKGCSFPAAPTGDIHSGGPGSRNSGL